MLVKSIGMYTLWYYISLRGEVNRVEISVLSSRKPFPQIYIYIADCRHDCVVGGWSNSERKRCRDENRRNKLLCLKVTSMRFELWTFYKNTKASVFICMKIFRNINIFFLTIFTDQKRSGRAPALYAIGPWFDSDQGVTFWSNNWDIIESLTTWADEVI